MDGTSSVVARGLTLRCSSHIGINSSALLFCCLSNCALGLTLHSRFGGYRIMCLCPCKLCMMELSQSVLLD